MDDQYEKMAKIFKSLSDPKRVQILDMLSEGELCACELLKHFHISQPTLSHDMKQLTDAGIVNSRRDGQKNLYSLNLDFLLKMQQRLIKMIENDPTREKAE